MSKLERLQQASDILRRTSRFVILARRLELQLAEMNKADGPEPESTKAKLQTNGTSTSGPGARAETPVTLESEDEKERAIAKAALTIAELS